MSAILAHRYGLSSTLIRPDACMKVVVHTPMEEMAHIAHVSSIDLAYLPEAAIDEFRHVLGDSGDDEVDLARITSLHNLAIELATDTPWAVIRAKSSDLSAFLEIEIDLARLEEQRARSITGLAAGELRWYMTMGNFVRSKFLPGYARHRAFSLTIPQTVEMLMADVVGGHGAVHACAFSSSWASLRFTHMASLPFIPHAFRNWSTAMDCFCRVAACVASVTVVSPRGRAGAWSRVADAFGLPVILYQEPSDMDRHMGTDRALGPGLRIYTPEFLRHPEVAMHRTWVLRAAAWSPDTLATGRDIPRFPDIPVDLGYIQMSGILRKVHDRFPSDSPDSIKLPHLRAEARAIVVDASCGLDVIQTMFSRNETVPVFVWESDRATLQKVCIETVRMAPESTQGIAETVATVEQLIGRRHTQSRHEARHRWLLTRHAKLPYDMHCRRFVAQWRASIVSPHMARVLVGKVPSSFISSSTASSYALLEAEMRRRGLSEDYEPVEGETITALCTSETDMMYVAPSQCRMMLDSVVLKLFRVTKLRRDRLACEDALARKAGPARVRIMEKAALEECAVCKDSDVTPNVVLSKCGHMFCLACYEGLVLNSRRCALCRVNIDAGAAFYVFKGEPLTCYSDLSKKTIELFDGLHDSASLLVVIPPKGEMERNMPKEVVEQFTFDRWTRFNKSFPNASIAAELHEPKQCFVVRADGLSAFPDDVCITHMLVIGTMSIEQMDSLQRILTAQLCSVDITMAAMCDDMSETSDIEKILAECLPPAVLELDLDVDVGEEEEKEDLDCDEEEGGSDEEVEGGSDEEVEVFEVETVVGIAEDLEGADGDSSSHSAEDS